ncbi:uroporphyrinogen-III synthase, partial [Propylenella binzhouense]
MRLVVTRPEPDGGRTARLLEALGHSVILSPALAIHPDPGVRLPVRRFQAVLVTSANAVRALAARHDADFLKAVPLLAVGDQTAVEAKRSGFPAARSAGGSAEELIALAAGCLSPAGGPLFYAAGETTSTDLAGRLRALGFEVESRAVYRADPEPRLAPAAAEAIAAGTVDGILFHSRRSAAAFALAARAARLVPLPEAVACYCLSERVAEPVRPIAAGP